MKNYKYKLKENKTLPINGDEVLTEEYLKKSNDLLEEFHNLVKQGHASLEKLKKDGLKK